jgi:hypothetical protein
MSTANAAADRLCALIRMNGHDFLRMPASVKAYLAQQLHDLPEERDVLLAAYEAGMHEQVKLQSIDRREFHHRMLANKFAKTAGVHPDWARWAVNVWAAAMEVNVNIPKSFELDSGSTYAEANKAIQARRDDDPQLKILRGGSPMWHRAIFTIIVVAGGFLGAFLGRSWPIAAIVMGFDMVDATMGRAEYEKYFPMEPGQMDLKKKILGYIVFFFVFSTPVALSAALGSLLGWWFGRADGRPWIGFMTCFGAAFGTNTILVLICGCFVTIVSSFFVCFAAAFKTASTTN